MWLQKKQFACLFMLTATGILSGCYHAAPIRQVNAQGEESPLLAIMTDSSRSAFWSYTAVHGGEGIDLMQERGASIKPGIHSFQVIVYRRSKLALLILEDKDYVDAVCAFDMDVMPGYTYTLGEVNKKEAESTASRRVYRADMDLIVKGPERVSETRIIPVECASHKYIKVESLFWENRVDELCSAKYHCDGSNEKCVINDPFTYGVCVEK